MAQEEKKLKGQMPNEFGKCKCSRCGKMLTQVSFYQYKDGSKCQMCKACLTAHIDNFDPSTFEWILEKMDVPYVPIEWNTLRDRAFAKDPNKMNGMSVIGKYLAKMKLKQYGNMGYADSAEILAKMGAAEAEKAQKLEQEKKEYEAELKVKLSEGKISQAEYKTLVSTETQHNEYIPPKGDLITGIGAAGPTSYQQALRLAKNPYQEQNFLPQSVVYPGVELSDDDKLYLAVKWGRLYTPYQLVALQQLFNEFMDSFPDIGGAARIDTLKKICKTSLKMDQAIDCGDIDAYQKLSRVYDAMMKSANFTEAQLKKKQQEKNMDSISALVEFVEKESGCIPRFNLDTTLDRIDQIIKDLKTYTKNLIYEDKSLAREIEDYLKKKEISEAMKKDRQEAANNQGTVELQDEDYEEFISSIEDMKQHDSQLNDDIIEKEYKEQRIGGKNE